MFPLIARLTRDADGALGDALGVGALFLLLLAALSLPGLV